MSDWIPKFNPGDRVVVRGDPNWNGIIERPGRDRNYVLIRLGDPVPEMALESAIFPREYTFLITAKKDHCCSLCGLTIHRGEKYRRQGCGPWVNSESDGVWTLKSHAVCSQFWNIIAKEQGYLLGEVRMFRQEMNEWLGQLSVGGGI